MDSFGSVAGASAVFVVAGMTMVWGLSLALRDASIVDIFWGLGFVGIGWTSFVVGAGAPARSALVLTCVTLWGLRLGLYLLWRNWGAGEDPRYVRMRAKHGDAFPFVSLYMVFGLQGVVMFIVSLPVQWVMASGAPTALGAWDWLGAALFTVGLLFESVGDWQLARFKSNPTNHGQVMDRGLWAWTRHPNYFGDSLAWWGIFAMACATEWGAWTILGPALMTFFLVKVSGAALLERGLSRSKPGYAEYVASTSGFIPRPPRRSASNR